MRILKKKNSVCNGLSHHFGLGTENEKFRQRKDKDRTRKGQQQDKEIIIVGKLQDKAREMTGHRKDNDRK